MTAERPEISPATASKTGRGCLFWTLVIVVVVAVVVGGGGYLAYRYTIDRITDATQLDLGELALSPAELGRLDGRLAAFVHALRNKNPIEPLVLTSEDVTALVARSPEFRRLGASARFSIEDGKVGADLSVPLKRMGYPDRWLNGSAVFAVMLENGVLIVTLQSGSVKGEPVPGWIVRQLRYRNFAEDLHENPLAAGLVARLESIEVRKGQITLVPRIRR
jgi:hypothetical protein